MNKTKQFGISLIIIGFFMPSILYPFTDLTTEAAALKVIFATEGVLYDTTLRDLEVVLVKGEWRGFEKGAGPYVGRLAIPYRYTLAFGILLAFSGIGVVTLSRKKKIAN